MWGTVSAGTDNFGGMGFRSRRRYPIEGCAKRDGGGDPGWPGVLLFTPFVGKDGVENGIPPKSVREHVIAQDTLADEPQSFCHFL
ncbi:hypothetical protein [Amycolatopsis sp. NPDC054798]